MLQEIDPTQLKTTRQIVEAHPGLVTRYTLHHYSRKRDENGLTDGGICFKGRRKEMLWHEQRFLAWLIGENK